MDFDVRGFCRLFDVEEGLVRLSTNTVFCYSLLSTTSSTLRGFALKCHI